MSEEKKKRKKAETKAHVDGVKATGEALPTNVPGTSISPTTNTTDMADFPVTEAAVEMPLEAELTEEIEAVEDAVTEAVEAVVDTVHADNEGPKETVVEAEPDATSALDEDFDMSARLEIKPTEQPLEAESEPSAELTIEEAREAAEFAEFQRLKRLARIKELQAELAELEPK